MAFILRNLKLESGAQENYLVGEAFNSPIFAVPIPQQIGEDPRPPKNTSKSDKDPEDPPRLEVVRYYTTLDLPEDNPENSTSKVVKHFITIKNHYGRAVYFDISGGELL